MIKRIFVGIADRPYTVSATRHATGIASHSNAMLIAMAVLDTERIRHTGPTPIGAGAVVKEWREELIRETEQTILESTEAFKRICAENRLRSQVVSRSGDPLDEFVKASRYYDFFVVGLHKLFEHGTINDVPDSLVKLISSGVYPMLAVPDHYRPIERVVVAYSGSIESARTLRSFAQHHHLWPIREVQIVNFGSHRSEGVARLIEARDYLEEHGIPSETNFIDDSSRKLPEYADDWNADMIVLGNSAKNLLRRKVFGETALKTIRESKIPLFLAQ